MTGLSGRPVVRRMSRRPRRRTVIQVATRTPGGRCGMFTRGPGGCRYVTIFTGTRIYRRIAGMTRRSVTEMAARTPRGDRGMRKRPCRRGLITGLTGRPGVRRMARRLHRRTVAQMATRTPGGGCRMFTRGPGRC